LERLIRYPWPGNIRQLQKVLCRAVGMCRGVQIMPEDLDFGDCGSAGTPSATPNSDEAAAREGLRQAIDRVWNSEQERLWPALQERLERELLLYALAQPGISQVQLARKLGVARNTLRARLGQFGLKMPGAEES